MDLFKITTMIKPISDPRRRELKIDKKYNWAVVVIADINVPGMDRTAQVRTQETYTETLEQAYSSAYKWSIKQTGGSK